MGRGSNNLLDDICAGHGWAGLDKDIPTIADWFDKHLKRRD